MESYRNLIMNSLGNLLRKIYKQTMIWPSDMNVCMSRVTT